MSLLQNFPHECQIRKRVRSIDEYGGNRDESVVVSSGVKCWEQQASASEVSTYQKRGMSISTKIFFTTDPGVTEQNQILITKRLGVAVSEGSQYILDVMSKPEPDSSAGLSVVWRVMCNRVTGEDQ